MRQDPGIVYQHIGLNIGAFQLIVKRLPSGGVGDVKGAELKISAFRPVACIYFRGGGKQFVCVSADAYYVASAFLYQKTCKLKSDP